MMVHPSRKTPNPFYVALVLIGILFTVTACAYGVMTIQQMNPSGTQQPHPMTALLDEYGAVILAIELILLAIATVAAIGTDEYWMRLNDRRLKQEVFHDESQSG